MLRKKKNNTLNDNNLDPLMDVLTCTVGVMLFVVIFTVMEARTVSYKIFTPLQTNEIPKSKSRILLICKDGRIKPMNLSKAYEHLKMNSITYENMPQIIEEANNANSDDEYYEFKYELVEKRTYWAEERWPVIHIYEKKQGGDDKTSILQTDSDIRQMINVLNPDLYWIAFAVCDETSIDVFREARNIANAKGISNGWDPYKISFPVHIPLNYTDAGPPELFLPQ